METIKIVIIIILVIVVIMLIFKILNKRQRCVEEEKEIAESIQDIQEGFSTSSPQLVVTDGNGNLSMLVPGTNNTIMSDSNGSMIFTPTGVFNNLSTTGNLDTNSITSGNNGMQYFTQTITGGTDAKIMNGNTTFIGTDWIITVAGVSESSYTGTPTGLYIMPYINTTDKTWHVEAKHPGGVTDPSWMLQILAVPVGFCSSVNNAVSVSM